MPAKIHGHVRYAETDLPVADATVILDKGPGPAPDIAAVTDENGAFEFHGVPRRTVARGGARPGRQAGRGVGRGLRR